MTTLKVNYPQYHGFEQNLQRLNHKAMMLESAAASFSMSSKKISNVRDRTSLSRSDYSYNEDEDASQNLVNVLGSKAEMSLSCASFSNPRRSTIDADVSFLLNTVRLYSSVFIYIKKGQTTQIDHWCARFGVKF